MMIIVKKTIMNMNDILERLLCLSDLIDLLITIFLLRFISYYYFLRTVNIVLGVLLLIRSWQEMQKY